MSSAEWYVRNILAKKGIIDYAIQSICIQVCLINLEHEHRPGETIYKFLTDHKGLFLQEAEARRNEWNNLKVKLSL